MHSTLFNGMSDLKIETLTVHISFCSKLKSPKPSSLLQHHEMRQRNSEIERVKRREQEPPHPATTGASASATLLFATAVIKDHRGLSGLGLDQGGRDSTWNRRRKIKNQNYEENQRKQVNYGLKFSIFKLGKL